MKRIVILGGGTGGTMMAVKLRRVLEPEDWEIVVVDRDDRHLYQPGLIFLPFGIYTEGDLHKPRSRFMPPGVKLAFGEVDAVDPEASLVRLQDGRRLRYDLLVLATGSRIVPEETEGMAGTGWQRTVFDFYTLEGARALGHALRDFDGGRLVVHLTDMPIKCPVAPLEFAFLTDWYLRKEGLRKRTELSFVTSLPDVFTKARAAEALGHLFHTKEIAVESSFATASVDGEAGVMKSWDDRQVDFDLLVTIPVHRGSEVVARSGMGDAMDWIPTDPRTLQSKAWSNVFVIGDATDLPTSKAGSVAHFQAEVLLDNVLRWIGGREPLPEFDGHANCFIETGFGKAVLLDFNYETEPLPGDYPLPGAGPFSLLAETEANHWGKMAFRSVYWNLLMKGADLSAIGPAMSLAGKWS
ncbi:MAG: FAD/NAD(P)-binding oxidoreductase [Gemmatimonadota bacterium]|jgi:sulfide:quinone oxidoreductase